MVSVIIPIYNVERYLRKCLNSVLRQTYKDMEVILVNDASPDGSLTVCEQFAARDPRVRIIDKKVNEGVDLARFSGLDAAQGEYIYFIDPDDWLARRDIIELMVEKADETGVDYVVMGHNKVIGSHGLLKRKVTLTRTGLFSKEDINEIFYPGAFGWPQFSMGLWDKLYRKETIDNSGIEPSKARFSQDLIFNLRLFPYLNSLYLINICGYNYRDGGITSKKKNWKAFFDAQKTVYVHSVREADKHNYPRGKHLAWIYLLAKLEGHLVSMGASMSRDEFLKFIEEERRDGFWNDFFAINVQNEGATSGVMSAFKNGDFDTVYSTLSKSIKKQKAKNIIKTILTYPFRIMI